MTTRTSRAKSWPKEVNALRHDAISFGYKAIKDLREARGFIRHSDLLLAIDAIAEAEGKLIQFVAALERAGDQLKNVKDDEE